MTINITAFERSPGGGKGLARDMRARWALEEVGQPCEVRLVSFHAMKEPAHLARHPFGRIRPKRKAISSCSRRGDRLPYRRAPCGAAAKRTECPRACDHMDVGSAQHGGAADP